MLVVSVGLVMPQVTKEWDVRYPSMITAALYAGSLVGAILCGYAADVIGRRLIWQLSLLEVTIFTMVSAASPNFTALALFIGLQTIGAGGNSECRPDGPVVRNSLVTRWLTFPQLHLI